MRDSAQGILEEEMTQMNKRARAIASLAGASLMVSTVGLVTGLGATSAVSAPVAGDCAVPFPVADLESGDEVNGMTVAKGTTPAPFTGEVIGVIEGGIDYDIDMIVVDLTSPDIDRVGSIWSGMSGSPVYAADGRLIGAVSYGLSYGPSQIAGVTPYEKMDDYLAAAGAPRAKVSVDKGEAKQLAQRAGISTAQAAKGFKRLSVPMTVSGVDPTRVNKVAKREYLRNPAKGASGVGRAAVGPETIVAGGNLGAAVSHGMVNYSGVGTVTSVCDDEVVGFGHRMAYLGDTSMTMHPADALFVQPDSLGSAFKVANLGAPVGVIDNDRWAAISGRLGPIPSGTRITSSSKLGSRSYAGTSTVTEPLYVGEVAWYHLYGTNDRAVDGYAKGDALVNWSIKGKDAAGTAFELKKTDRYASYYDLASEGAGEVPDLVYALSELHGVTVTSVDATSTLQKNTGRHRIQSIQRLAKGKWVDVDSTIRVKAGKKLRLRAVVSGPGGRAYRPVAVKVPRRMKGTKQSVYVVGGSSHYADGNWRSLSGLKTYVASKVRNDTVVAVVGNNSRKSKSVQSVSAPGAKVVAGQKRIRIVVK